MKESMDILESKWRLTMEKQNDHKKFSKKIWVLSAGIIVILAIVLAVEGVQTIAGKKKAAK